MTLLKVLTALPLRVLVSVRAQTLPWERARRLVVAQVLAPAQVLAAQALKLVRVERK